MGSYTDVLVDNPYLENLICEYKKSDFCCFDENWSDSGTIDVWRVCGLPDFLRYLTMVSTSDSDKVLKKEKKEICRHFRFAKCNMGYEDDDSYEGEESHTSLSSRWGVFNEYTVYDADEDCWEDSEIKTKKPDPDLSLFSDARPEDVKVRPQISNKMQLVLDHLSSKPVNNLKGIKNIMFIGAYDQYGFLAPHPTRKGHGNDFWEDRQTSLVLRGNYTEVDMITWWMSENGSNCSVWYPGAGEIDQCDYVVVRLDQWAELCINEKDILKAVELNIPVISEYQLWKAIFDPEGEIEEEQAREAEFDDWMDEMDEEDNL